MTYRSLSYSSLPCSVQQLHFLFGKLDKQLFLPPFFFFFKVKAKCQAASGSCNTEQTSPD